MTEDVIPVSADPLLPQPFLVKRFKRETHDIFSLWLKSKRTPSEFKFLPGQFNMLYAFGIGEVPISISGSQTQNDEVIIHTIRAVGPVTRALQKLRSGDTMGVRGPYGSPWPLDQTTGQDVLILAGGIGLAPLRTTLLELLFGQFHPRKVILIYGARTPKDIIFTHELESWQQRHGLILQIIVDRSVLGWTGHVGLVPELISKVQFQPDQCLALLCGPEVMMRFSILELKKCGVKDSSIFLSMERNMKCAVGLCGRCQFVPYFICKDGPVFSYDKIQMFFGKKEI